MTTATSPTTDPAVLPTVTPLTLREVAVSLAWAVVVPELASLLFLVGMKIGLVPSSTAVWVLPVAALPGALDMWWWLRRAGRSAADVDLIRPRGAA